MDFFLVKPRQCSSRFRHFDGIFKFGDENQDFGGGPMDDMYAGEPSYDDDVEHDQAAYQQQFLDFREFLVK